MAHHLPVMSGRDTAAFGRAGWSVARQSASHIVMTKPGEAATLCVPDHREVARGTLRSLIRSAGMTVDEFLTFSRSK